MHKWHKNQINVWFGSHCFELSSSPLLRVWLAFVSAMIVCYLKPKLRARVVLLLVTILVTARERSGSYCDTAFFILHSTRWLMHWKLCVCARVCFFLLWARAHHPFRLDSNHRKTFLWVFFISAISSFFPWLSVICTCFTMPMVRSLLINGNSFGHCRNPSLQ